MADWVVIVDDDVVNLKRSGAILAGNGIHATAVRSGATLLDFLASNTPDLILLDILMPGMDGPETLRRLRREIPSGDSIPVIMMTADVTPDLESFCLQLGAAGFLRKPFDADTLVRRVRQVLHGSSSGQPETMNLDTVTALLEQQDMPADGIWMGR